MNFYYNGTSCADFGLFVEHRPVQAFPKRIIESISIPGRNGNILFDTGAYDNVTVTYPVAYRGDVRFNGVQIATWLYQNQYLELTDDYEPGHFRKAVYVSPLNIADVLNVAGRANVTFSCLPQRFLKTGKQELTPTNGATITNYYQDAKPLLTVSGTGSGTVTIGNATVTISDIGTTMVIDCEAQNATVNNLNANNRISLNAGFPVLMNGSNTISWTGGVTSVGVVPNWWTL